MSSFLIKLQRVPASASCIYRSTLALHTEKCRPLTRKRPQLAAKAGTGALVVSKELVAAEKSMAHRATMLARLAVLCDLVPEAVVHARELLLAFRYSARDRLAHPGVCRHVHLARVLIGEHSGTPRV